ncbi:MAG: winged helix DNA-binding domain-containing protein, partial [Solirubrobacterales bacterium]|nr:winged helix DNA-binding domain-containing protein [Solirubrobacterales bacterium]
MPSAITPSRLARMRLGAQRLAAETAAHDPVEAARAVLGVQAQDVRAAALALRARVPGLERNAVDETPLVRTW